MKNTNKCPKCGSDDIKLVVDPQFMEHSGNSIRVGFMASVDIHRYVCCSCGFTEEWIDKKDIPALRKAFK